MLQPIRIPISILRAHGVKNETAILTIAVNAITVEYCPRSKTHGFHQQHRGNGYIGEDRRHAQGSVQ